MHKTPENEAPPLIPGAVFSEQWHRIRDTHIDVESILQSLAALQDENVCASCAHVCCKEAICRESMDSDFLRFVLGSRAADYDIQAGWYVPGSGCRLSYGRPLICYEFFCERYDMPGVNTPHVTSMRQLSRAFKTVYAGVFAGQHMLVVEDINRITAHKLNIIHERLENLKMLANTALRHALGQRLAARSSKGQPDVTAVSDPQSIDKRWL